MMAFGEDLNLECDFTDLCLCEPPKHFDCSEGQECPQGETCGFYREVEIFCMSPNDIGRDGITVIKRGGGFALDAGEDDEDCSRGLACVFREDDTPCVERDEC